MRMGLVLLAEQLRCVIAKTTKTANLVVLRAFTTQHEHHCSGIDDGDEKLLYHSLQHGYSPNPQSLAKLISLSAKMASLGMGIQIHAAIFKMGFCSNVYIGSALVDMYGKCGTMSDAQKCFDEMPDKNVVTWNSLVSGYLEVDCPKKAIGLFLKMLKEGITPTPFSLSSALVGCSQLGAEELGAQVHCLNLKMGSCYSVVVGTGLIDMYSSCWNIDDSRGVFDEMLYKNVITWTSMVTGYAQNEQPDKAMILMREMLCLDLKPTCVAYNSLMCSFSCPDYWNHCRQIHCQIIKVGFEFNGYIVVTLMTTYSKCNNSLEDFEKLCLCVTRWDNISWNAVIAGFSNLGIGEQALKCFSEMRETDVSIDLFTLASVLRAISIMSALEEGKQIHALVCKIGHGSNLYVQNGLVSMYARCGAIDDSKQVFVMMDEHDVITWNSLLSGCSQHGLGWETVELFEQMRRTCIKPNDTTFLVVLTACSHVGMLEEGLEYFNLMRSNRYFLSSLRMEHYATIVDLLGRTGNLSEAKEFIERMPVKAGPSVYKALLSACQIHGNKEIAFYSAKKLLQLCPDDPATYVLLANVLMTKGYWDGAAGMWKLMFDRRIKKYPGYSWI